MSDHSAGILREAWVVGTLTKRKTHPTFPILFFLWAPHKLCECHTSRRLRISALWGYFRQLYNLRDTSLLRNIEKTKKPTSDKPHKRDCRILGLLHFEVCRIIEFVSYWVCSIIGFVQLWSLTHYRVCRKLWVCHQLWVLSPTRRFVASYGACRQLRNVSPTMELVAI